MPAARLRALAAISAALAEPGGVDDALLQAAEETVRVVGELCVIYRVGVDATHMRVVAVAHRDPAMRADIELLKTLRGAQRPVVFGEPGAGGVAATSHAVLIAPVSDAQRALIAGSPERLEVMERIGLTSAAIAPLRTPSGIVGVLCIGAGPSAPQLVAEDLDFLQQLADRMGAALGRDLLIDELARHELRLAKILDELPEGVVVHPESGKPLANRAARYLAEDRGDPLGQLAQASGAPLEEEQHPIARALRGENVDGDYRVGPHRTLHLRSAPLSAVEGERAAVAVFHDVTRQRRLERATRFLANAATLLSSTLDHEETLKRVARSVVPELADWCIFDLVGDDGATEMEVVAHADPEHELLARDMRARFPRRANSVVSKVLQTGRPTLVPTLSDAFMVAHSQDAEHLRALRELGIRSAMVVPLAVRDDVIGAMTLASVAPERAYDDEDLALAMEVAHRCALAVTNARLFQKAEAARARAEHLVEQAKGLQALVDELSSPQSPDALAGFVMDAGGSAVGASTSGFWLLEGQTLRLLEARNYAPEQRERYAHVPLDAATPIAEAARGGEPVFVRTLSDYTARYGDDELRAPGADPVPRLSMALLPLIAEGELLGALAFVFHEERAFADDDQRFLRVLARHCALALARNRSLERERQTAHQAQLADRRKDEFLAMLGHELRNPLMPIMTALELMRMRGEGTLINERAIIDRQARHMLRLVDDLLDVSRITRGRIELVRKHVELAAVVRGAVETASVLFEQRAQKLTVDVAEQGLLIDGDEARLVQVTSNLLTNAAKYTDPGGAIDVRAAREGDTVVLRVRDTGVGMSAELLPRVFDLFAQGERTLDRSEGGLGLGLAIVKSIVQLHGGTAEATSEGIGRGCELIVRLPVVPDAPPPTPAPTPAAPRPAAGAQQRVLVVDDNKDAASLLAELLGLVGREVRVAYDGPSALVVAGAQKLDVALLDIGLPVMDGYELAERLQAAQPGIVLFAITGYGQPADVERAHAAGFRHHLVKPVELDQLLLLLDEAAKERG